MQTATAMAQTSLWNCIIWVRPRAQDEREYFLYLRDSFSYIWLKTYVVTPRLNRLLKRRFRWEVATYVFVQNWQKLFQLVTKHSFLSRALRNPLHTKGLGPEESAIKNSNKTLKSQKKKKKLYVCKISEKYWPICGQVLLTFKMVTDSQIGLGHIKRLFWDDMGQLTTMFFCWVCFDLCGLCQHS